VRVGIRRRRISKFRPWAIDRPRLRQLCRLPGSTEKIASVISRAARPRRSGPRAARHPDNTRRLTYTPGRSCSIQFPSPVSPQGPASITTADRDAARYRGAGGGGGGGAHLHPLLQFSTRVRNPRPVNPAASGRNPARGIETQCALARMRTCHYAAGSHFPALIK